VFLQAKLAYICYWFSCSCITCSIICSWRSANYRWMERKRLISEFSNLGRRNVTTTFFSPWWPTFNANQLTTKFLGVYIDEHLTWKDYISYLCKQISKSIGKLFRSRFYLSSKTKLTLYYSLLNPYITYCNSTWSSTYVSNLNRIYCLQKRAVQPITIACIIALAIAINSQHLSQWIRERRSLSFVS